LFIEREFGDSGVGNITRYHPLKKELGLLGAKILHQEILHLFFVLGTFESLSVSELVEKSGLSPYFITKLIPILKDKGVINIQRNSKDRRKKYWF